MTLESSTLGQFKVAKSSGFGRLETRRSRVYPDVEVLVVGLCLNA